MSFDVVPPGGPGAYDGTGRVAPVSKSAAAGFSRVYELEEARRRVQEGPPRMAGDRIPPEVWAEVDRAAQLVETLHAEGRRMVFDTDRLTGRVVAALVDDSSGAHVRDVPLSEVVGQPAPAAAPTPPASAA